MAFRHGKNGNATVGAGPTTLKITGWSADDQNDLADSSNTTGGGFKEYTAGLDGCDWSIDAQVETTKVPYDATGGALVPGTELTNLKLYVGAPTATPNFHFPVAIVEKCSIKSVVNGVITYTVTGKNQGTFTRPATA
jgi:hypothetical protein